MARPRSPASTEAGPASLRLPAVVLAVTLTFSMLSAIYVWQTARQEDELRFQNAINGETVALTSRLDAFAALLGSGSALYASTDSVSPEAFRVFAARIDLQRYFRGVQGVGFAQRVTPETRARAVAELRRQGLEVAQVWPERDQEQYPVVRLEPLDRRNRASMGFDMFQEPVRRAAMMAALDSATVRASGRVTLVQEIDPQDQQAGFLIYLPVYRRGFVPATVEERRESIIGFVYCAIRADDLLRTALGPQDRDPVYVEVYDGAQAAKADLLHDSRRWSAVRPVGYRPRFADTVQVDVYGRTWTLVFSSHPSFGRAPGYIFAPFLLALSALVSLALFLLTRAQTRAHVEADRVATELRASEAALRQSELRFRTMIEQAPFSMQILAPEGNSVRVNRAYEELWGLTAADLTAYNVFRDERLIKAGVMPFVRRAFAGDATESPPVRVRLDRGAVQERELWIKAFVYPVKDEAGRLREVVVVHEDITEQRRSEEALRHAQKLESIGVLAGGIAHDFNNLLTGILGNASLAQRALPAESKARERLDDVMRACERAAGLTRQLLAYAGKGRFFIERVDVCRLVREITELVRTSIPKKVQVHVDLADGCPPVEADASQIQQLIMNLVINAGEAIGDAVGEVTVAVGERTLGPEDLSGFPAFEVAPGEHVAIVVADTGVGMDEATLRRIFDPFFTTKFTGRGLGLAAALGIVRGHRGAIAVESAPGRGSTFTVLLPVAPPEEVMLGMEEPLDTIGLAPPPPAEARTAGTILVADDEEGVRGLVRETLEAEGFRVLEAEDGGQALAVFRGESADVDLVVLDLTMPVLGGDEVLSRLRRLRPDVPVLMMSGYGAEETRRRLSGPQIRGFLQKPFTPDQLAAAVRAALAPAAERP